MKVIYLILILFLTNILLLAQTEQDDGQLHCEEEGLETLLSGDNEHEGAHLSDDDESVNTLLSVDVDYFYELIKFYLSEHEFDLALTYLDSSMVNPTDSLYYFKGIALQGKNEWHDAADNFALSIITHRQQGILQKAKKEFKIVLLQLPAMESISILSSYLDRIKNDDILAQFLFVMAEIYEEIQLFDEANDVYQTILNDTDYLEQVPINLRIVTNFIFLKNYQEAIKILKPVISLNDSIFNEDALFYYYVANYSVENFSKAKDALLRLYREYPDHQKMNEILRGLAELFEEENLFLMSWFFYHELKSISNEAQKFIVQKEIERLKLRIGKDQNNIDQFKYLIPNFEN